MREYQEINQVVLLDKPTGVSSNHILQRVKRLLRAKKAGHTGCLDPLATGMLPICLGEATKFSSYMLEADKVYRVVAKWGEQTDTADSTGAVIQTSEGRPVRAQIEAALPAFLGQISQVPPMYSALKHQGKPLYKLARQGEVIERAARLIEIFSLTCLASDAETATFEVHCSKGTYIRTLVEDIAQHLGTLAHVIDLRRLRVGHYQAEQMITWEALQHWAENKAEGFAESKTDLQEVAPFFFPVESLLAGLPTLQLTAEEALRVTQGQRVVLSEAQMLAECLVLYDPQHRLLGVGECDLNSRVLHAKRLVASQ
jgi:tRNA pseudouridine55 synthase